MINTLNCAGILLNIEFFSIILSMLNNPLVVLSLHIVEFVHMNEFIPSFDR